MAGFVGALACSAPAAGAGWKARARAGDDVEHETACHRAAVNDPSASMQHAAVVCASYVPISCPSNYYGARRMYAMRFCKRSGRLKSFFAKTPL